MKFLNHLVLWLASRKIWCKWIKFWGHDSHKFLMLIKLSRKFHTVTWKSSIWREKCDKVGWGSGVGGYFWTWDTFVGTKGRGSVSHLFAHLQLTEEQMYRNTRDESPPSDLSSHSGPALPLIGSSGSAEKKFSEHFHTRHHHTLSRDPRAKKLSLGSGNGILSTSSGHEYGYINHG